jgi:hypothetical protein
MKSAQIENPEYKFVPERDVPRKKTAALMDALQDLKRQQPGLALAFPISREYPASIIRKRAYSYADRLDMSVSISEDDKCVYVTRRGRKD